MLKTCQFKTQCKGLYRKKYSTISSA